MSTQKEPHGWFSPGRLQPLDWLLLAVPAAFAIRYVPAWKYKPLLFIFTDGAIIPLADGRGATPKLAQVAARRGREPGGIAVNFLLIFGAGQRMQW